MSYLTRRHSALFTHKSLNPHFQYKQVEVQVVATQSSLHFYDFQAIKDSHDGRVKVWTDTEEWKVRPKSRRLCSSLWRADTTTMDLQGWENIGDPILHIEVKVVCTNGSNET